LLKRGGNLEREYCAGHVLQERKGIPDAHRLLKRTRCKLCCSILVGCYIVRKRIFPHKNCKRYRWRSLSETRAEEMAMRGVGELKEHYHVKRLLGPNFKGKELEKQE
jgi:hypothetical protein